MVVSRPSSRTRLMVRWSFALVVLMVPGALRAQAQVNHLYDKLQISVSGANVHIGPEVRIDPANGEGTTINFGKVLGLNQNGFQPQVGVRWKPGRRHELSATYLFLTRSGNKSLNEDVIIGDSTFEAGLNVNTSFGGSTVALAYRFAFMAKENTQLGAQLALGYIFFNIGLDATANAASNVVTKSYNKDLPGPVVALGVFGRFKFGEHWYMEADGGAIGVSVDNVKATEYALGAAGRYFLSKRIGFEAGLQLTGVILNVNRQKQGAEGTFDVKGKIKYPFQTFRLGAIVAFP